MSDRQMPDSWITPGAAAEFAGVLRSTVYRWIYAGIVTVRRMPRVHPRVLKSEIEKLAAKHTRPAT